MEADERDARLSDGQDVDVLVRGLDNLVSNSHAQMALLTLGERAVPALVRFLLEAPSQFPEGRVSAAQALGHIKGEAAFHGLMKALDPLRFEGLGPVLRLSEETVQNAVARQLTRLGDRRAIPVLLEALRTRHLVGAAEAVVEFHETDALPSLVEGLEDAFKRDRFAQAILGMGRAAIPPLIATLGQRRMHDGQELLPSIERRAEALRLLGGLRAKEAAESIRTALHDPDGKVRTEAALALVAVAGRGNLLEAVPILLAGLTHPDFLQRERCAEALANIGPLCSSLIEHALVQNGVTVMGETVLLTAPARTAALMILDRMKGLVPC